MSVSIKYYEPCIQSVIIEGVIFLEHFVSIYITGLAKALLTSPLQINVERLSNL